MELTDELTQKIYNYINQGLTYPEACKLLKVSDEECREWFYKGKAGSDQKLEDFYQQLMIIKSEYKNKNKMNPGRQTIILKSYCQKEKEINAYCELLCRNPFELDDIDAENMISELKLRYFSPKS